VSEFNDSKGAPAHDLPKQVDRIERFVNTLEGLLVELKSEQRESSHTAHGDSQNNNCPLPAGKIRENDLKVASRPMDAAVYVPRPDDTGLFSNTSDHEDNGPFGFESHVAHAGRS
jgi:hypothetical protein